MTTRREFLQLTSTMFAAMQMGLMAKTSSLMAAPPQNPFKGYIVAAAMNPKRKGDLSRETHDTVLSRLDLTTGKATLIPMTIDRVHDALKVKDQYVLMSNKANEPMQLAGTSDEGQKLILKGNKVVSGHGYFDEDNNVVIVSAYDLDRDNKGCFALFDPDDFHFLGFRDIEGIEPHDMQLLDKDTFAVCHYNQGYKARNDTNLHFYDRKTLKFKEKIDAYDNAMISHATVTDNGDLYAIGFKEHDDDHIEQWGVEKIIEQFQSFYDTHHPLLSDQWPEIAKQTPLHRVEKSRDVYGLPLLPMKMAAGSMELDYMNFDHFYHRRAQSICHVKQTNVVCMAFPHSDSILLYNATNNVSVTLTKENLYLKEMRGITEITGTPYLAVAGIRRGITIVDTSTYKPIQHFDVEMGRIIHMHHEV